MTVYSSAIWTLQRSGYFQEVNGDSPTRLDVRFMPCDLDDVIEVGRTFQQHLLNLQKVFQRFREACLKLNPEKCQLFRREFRYLGRDIYRPRKIESCAGKANPPKQT
jgi:hypothetical protein